MYSRKESDRRYREKHREEIKKRKLRWQQNNIQHLCDYQREKKNTDPKYKITCNLRSRMSMALRKSWKVGSAIRDLGCSISSFKDYIAAKFTEGMNWENYGKWHLDHIKPLCMFNLSDRAQFLEAAHYTNYQPLWASDNCRKNKYDDRH